MTHISLKPVIYCYQTSLSKFFPVTIFIHIICTHVYLQIEQEGLAVGLGFAGAAHFDMVLTKLEQMIKHDGSKKSGGIIGFLKVCIHRRCVISEACYRYSK